MPPGAMRAALGMPINLGRGTDPVSNGTYRLIPFSGPFPAPFSRLVPWEVIVLTGYAGMERVAV